MEIKEMNAFSRRLSSRLALALGLLALAAPVAAAETGSYGYLSVVEGSATLMQAGTDERSSAEINQPVLAGDRLSVPERSRVEIVLADRNILRVDGGTDLVLEHLAASPNGNDRATVLRLLEGNVQLIVTEDSLGDELPRVETPNATVYPQNFGSYRLTADRDGWSEVVVRRGTAQVVTDRGKQTVRADESAVIDGDRASAEIDDADTLDSLERWGRQLDDQYASSDVGPVDDNLRYQSASLSRHGDWIYADGSRYWRPRVASNWRPYWQGRWAYTPAGLTWISSEPWGWVPYHYGSWDYLPAYGWVWQPGYVWSAAWVYWYWGPSYVGWCPTGYYTRYYGSRFGGGFRSGLYGWAGGDWGYFDRWSFVNASYFRDGYRSGYRDGYWDGRRDVQRYAVPTDRSHGGRDGLERGIITTDTRPLKPNTWKNPEEVLRAARAGQPGRNGELQDVTAFIARKPNLPDTVTRTVRAEGNSNVLDGTPLKPSTLGRGRQAAGTNGAQPSDYDKPSDRPRISFGDDGPRGASPSKPGSQPNAQPNTQPAKPATRSGDSATGVDGSSNSGRPRIVIEKPARPSSEPSTRGSEPVVRERPSRPAPEADGGAPRPRRIEVDEKPSGRTPDRSSSGSSGSNDAPVVRERPSSRPAPEADGGSPRPDRGSRDNGDRGVRAPERAPDRPEVQERRPPVDRSEIQRQNERSRPEVNPYDRPMPRSEERAPYVRPDRVERSEPYVRPEPRPESRTSQPSYRAPESSSRPAPRVEPRSEPRSQPERSSRGNDGGGRDRGSRSNDRPQVRERRPPAE
jgi:hypothetical protein